MVFKFFFFSIIVVISSCSKIEPNKEFKIRAGDEMMKVCMEQAEKDLTWNAIFSDEEKLQNCKCFVDKLFSNEDLKKVWYDLEKNNKRKAIVNKMDMLDYINNKNEKLFLSY